MIIGSTTEHCVHWILPKVDTDISFNPRAGGVYFITPLWWGGGLFLAPPLISETTGPIPEIQTAFDSP